MIRSWNIRGLNGFSKQRAVRNWISDSSLGLISLLETKVEQSHLQSMVSFVCPLWQFLSNMIDSIACRVLVCWDSSLYSVHSLHCSLQEITCRVTHVSEGFSFWITFVNGSNDPRNRCNLWDFLRDQSAVFGSKGLPWLVLGDFNAILGASDRVGGDPAWYGYMDDFGQCIHDAELIGVPFTGLRYTWHNSQQGDGFILRKLDWVFASLSWFLDRPSIVSEFRPRDVSDHSSIVIRFGPRRGKVPSPFKFLNFWADHANFRDIVQAVWDEPIVGNPMFRLMQKLGLVKRKLKALHIRVSSHISSRDLLAAHSQPQIAEASRYFSGHISPDMISPLTAPITDDEIRIALFSIPDDKASGPDGFTSLFFKRAWDIIGTDFRDAVRHFFATNEMPRCVNATRIALVPKVESPSRMTDFRPISCCNVLYKCISTVIVNRFKVVLPDIIGVSQSAFVLGRRISDNILLTQELLRNYHLGGPSPRFALKVDIRKAFDTVSWEFILLGLRTVGFPERMVRWIMTCISTPYFSVALNGELHDFFRSSLSHASFGF
ncbi:uncharacterized protein LOC116145808 [Pistacia vera]|uniref:uncharacterized protein LOC116145808 n=1 Tax=Pistacia vera TaxID=55513 RepID=UPI001262C112|nr:uncharacterized protein LOC116145808 [Pistacia vera]